MHTTSPLLQLSLPMSSEGPSRRTTKSTSDQRVAHALQEGASDVEAQRRGRQTTEEHREDGAQLRPHASNCSGVRSSCAKKKKKKCRGVVGEQPICVWVQQVEGRRAHRRECRTTPSCTIDCLEP